MIYLPRVDENGEQYVSYSQIKLFKEDKTKYYKRYILGEKFEGNVWTDFGNKVGNALETCNFSEFNLFEQNCLTKVPRLGNFEYETRIQYDEFYVKCFIDTTDFRTVIDYKTGGAGKDLQYSDPSYTQLAYYALALGQEGYEPQEAKVIFIPRSGNPYKRQMLCVEGEHKEIEVDISHHTLTDVHDDILENAKKISDFYISMTQDIAN